MVQLLEWLGFMGIGLVIAWYIAKWVTKSLHSQRLMRTVLRLIVMLVIMVAWRADILLAIKIAQDWCDDPTLADMVKPTVPLEDYPVGRSVGGLCVDVCEEALYDYGIKRVYIFSVPDEYSYAKENSPLFRYELQDCESGRNGKCSVGQQVSMDEFPWASKSITIHEQTSPWEEQVIRHISIDRRTAQVVTVSQFAIVDIQWSTAIWNIVGDYSQFGRTSCDTNYFETFPALNTDKLQENDS